MSRDLESPNVCVCTSCRLLAKGKQKATRLRRFLVRPQPPPAKRSPRATVDSCQSDETFTRLVLAASRSFGERVRATARQGPGQSGQSVQSLEPRHPLPPAVAGVRVRPQQCIQVSDKNVKN